MNTERAILISFLGNYLTNTVVAAIVALVPAAANPGIFTAQYITYVILAAIVVGILTWWYMKSMMGAASWKSGLIFGVVGALVALVTAFVSGLAGVLGQTGSLSQMISIVPNFWPFLASVSTLVLVLIWLIPSTFVGWWLGRKAMPAPMM
ncbi:MAG TPA: hypothetical protein VHD38_02715 [Candidatus Paceibacterota bacterium]|nr:hypothetical protein [Candidatus Paceibacterota bacterium]